MKRLIPFLLCVIALSSCEVEFSPNAGWKETPVVYCVLDQDDTLSYVRVQKCFLGPDNNYFYAQQYDSINYAEGSLLVKMYERMAYPDQYDVMHPYDPPTDSFEFSYTLLGDKPEGTFNAPNQPVYVCNTLGRLDAGHMYELFVIRKDSGDTIASASTAMVGGPFNLQAGNGTFQFSGTEGSKTCLLKWDAMKRARRYQTMIRFYYRDFVEEWNGSSYDTIITPHHIDINGIMVKSSTTAATESYYFPQNRFLKAIQDDLSDKPIVNRNVIDTVDVYLWSCTEDLAAYLYVEGGNNSINQNEYVYTNIKGGLGVFAARRTHLFSRFPTPGSSNSQYKKALKELGLGF